MAIVECIDVRKTYQQGKVSISALENVNLSIEEGEFVALAGPSGSGKTTLLNIIGGLDQADSGKIMVDNRSLGNMSQSHLANLRLQKIGFVFQAYNLIPVLTAQENVEFVMQVQGVASHERAQKALEILNEVGLEGMEDRKPAQLSGGQQQRVAVARAIVSRPKLVLADEPTANLDSVASAQLMNLFSHLNQHHKITFIIATHDKRVMAYAKRLIKMRDGKIIGDEQQVPVVDEEVVTV